MTSKTRTVIGIIGCIGSGKDVAAKYIAKKLAISVFQVSQPLRDIAKKRGIEQTRENPVELGTKIAKEKGNEFLVKTLFLTAPGLSVFSGMRGTAQLKYLNKKAKLILIAIEAKTQIRFKRAIKKRKKGEAKTVEEFIRRKFEENSGHHTRRLFECLKMAKYHITNEKTLKNLFKEIDRILIKEKLVK